MSESLYGISGLRFWDENEIELREMFATRVISVIKRTLTEMNPAWSFAEVEGPILTPKGVINKAYCQNDFFITNHAFNNHARTSMMEEIIDYLCLRPETTYSSYLNAKNLMEHHKKKLPLCVYQKGKSFRRELNDGARASTLRFNEFWQLEFQCIYSDSTKADYRVELIEKVALEIRRFTGTYIRIKESDRLPSYSESTIDIEAEHLGNWREMASCSIRNDFADNIKVCEIAIGLDRLATLAGDFPLFFSKED